MTSKINNPFISVLATVLIGIIGTQIFYNWYSRPIIQISSEVFRPPEGYIDALNDKELKIPRIISTIEIKNVGKSVGNNLTLDFKTTKNIPFQNITIDSRSDVLKHDIDKARDGSTTIELDMDFIRPNEKVIVNAFSDEKTDFIISQSLISNGEIILEEDRNSKRKTVYLIVLILLSLYTAFLGIVIDTFLGRFISSRISGNR